MKLLILGKKTPKIEKALKRIQIEWTFEHLTWEYKKHDYKKGLIFPCLWSTMIYVVLSTYYCPTHTEYLSIPAPLFDNVKP